MADKMIEVIIERDIWVREGDVVTRYRKGTMTSVPLDEAVLDGIASGAVRRAKPEDHEARAKAKAKG